DIDLFCPGESTSKAVDALRSIGYTPAPWSRHNPSPLHFPAMIRGHKYVWRGNYFDPDMPLAIDIHSRLWNGKTYHFGPAALEEFWDRRIVTRVDDIDFPALHPVDAIGFAALHALRHAMTASLLHGHIYEIAWLLHATSGDETMWNQWLQWHTV